MNDLITDRTFSDVTQKTKKGYYNLEDLQRINSYIQYLSDELGLNLTVSQFSFGQALTKTEMQGIIDNVNTIRAAWYVAQDTPQTPQAFNWDYNKANDLEKIIQALYQFLQSAKIDKIYSGTFVSGNQIKFRGAANT